MSDAWSISVKTVGADTSPKSQSGDGSSKGVPSKFVVEVEPGEALSTLHDKIEKVTGLNRDRQRLIYRGRIIGGSSGVGECSNGGKIRDVDGLKDGHTIHLVPKPAAATTSTTTSTPDESNTENAGNHTSSSTSEGPSVISGSSGTSLLAALLGLGSSGNSSESASEEGSGSDDVDAALGAILALGTRSRIEEMRSRQAAARRRRVDAHRMSAEDRRRPDPGSLEPVRQGLMTLQTMLGATSSNHHSGAPLEATRRWYRGQWLDCRDTVNHWLEATVVDIVSPEDVLPNRDPSSRRRHTPGPPPDDPAVDANDMEGRRQLLLEPCESDDEDNFFEGFRERETNDGVQLLLVHYNGWPHRWDEWIRSDSERIRPFRTRTRHSVRSNHAGPTVQNEFRGAPSTEIRGGDDERAAMVSELWTVLKDVETLLSALVPPEHRQRHEIGAPSSLSQHLPWAHGTHSAFDTEGERSAVLSTNSQSVASSSHRRDKRRMESLAPLLDRLGRTVTDAAPHIAALAESLPDIRIEGGDEEQAEDAAESMVRSASRLFWGSSPDEASATTPLLTAEDGPRLSDRQPDDPDFQDFVNGMVNVSRGDPTIRSSGRVNRTRRTEDDSTNPFLASYLAGGLSGSSSNDDDDAGGESGRNVPRVVRLGGGDNGGGSAGIDIHIHAIVTGPGVGAMPEMPPGIAGFGMPFANETTDATSNFSFGSADQANNSTSTSNLGTLSDENADDEEDLALFDDLYSENPSQSTAWETLWSNLREETPPSESDEHFAELLDESEVAPVSEHEPSSGDGEAVTDAPAPNALQREDPEHSVSNARRPAPSRSIEREDPRRGTTFGRLFRRTLGGRR